MSVGFIKRGKAQYYAIECLECKSLLKFLRADEMYDSNINSNERFIICPECGNHVKTRYVGVDTIDYATLYDE